MTSPATHAADAILAAVLPADARAVAIHRGVASSLSSDSGIGPADVDVLADGQGGVPTAPTAVVMVEPADAGLDSSSGGRMVIRIGDHIRARVRTRSAARRLQAAGYGAATTIGWDRIQVARVPAATGPARALRKAELLPRRSVIVANRPGHDPAPTILEAAMAAAAGGPWPWPLVRSGTLVVLADEVVVRVAIGAGQSRLERAERVLRTLAGSLPEPGLVPRIEHSGVVGLGLWTAERRLRGTGCPPSPPTRVVDDLLEVLVALQSAATSPAPEVRALADPAAVALDGGRRSDALRAAADAVAGDLEGLPAALAHGDLWHGNLLLRNDRLVGIIDWDSASDGRLPFLDALHIVIAGRVPKGSLRWGAEVARALDDDVPELVARYGAAIGIPVDRSLHRSLVVAYWLDRIAFQLGTYADRVVRPRWLGSNVDVVLRALEVEHR